jgi:capsid protein
LETVFSVAKRKPKQKSNTLPDPREALINAMAFQAMNTFRGGVPTRTSESWQTAMGYRFGTSAEREQITSQRSRAYHAFKNNPIAKTLINTETDNVIGDGLNYQATSDSEEWNREAVDRYYKWLENCSVRGGDLQTGCEVQRFIWGQSRIAGDIGWILVSRGLDSRIQVVPAENISTPDGMYADKTVYDGIRFDSTGRPTLFYVLYHDERGIARRWEPVPARDFVFLPHFDDPNQARGISCFNTIFDLLAHLDRYVDGVSLAAWMATVFGIVFKQNSGAKQLGAMPYLANSQGNQQRAVTFENGMVKFVGTDEEVAQVQATQPMQQTPEFIRTMFRMLGQPFDMPLEVIAKDMSSCNFASARIGLLPFYRSCRIKAGRFASRWGRTIQWWLSRERLRPPGDPDKWKTPFPENYWAHELLPNEWDYTDPVSEAQADLLQIDMGTKSKSMVINERGRDGQRIRRERLEDIERDKDLPQVHSTMTRDDASVAAVAGPDPELERIKAEADAYGVAVRAGTVTPQTDDESHFRQKMGLPAMSADAQAAWKKDEGTRRPITITPPPGEEKPSPFGNKAIADGAEKSAAEEPVDLLGEILNEVRAFNKRSQKEEANV